VTARERREGAVGVTEPVAVGERGGHPTGRAALWLVLGCYLLGAVAVTIQLWVDPAGRAQVGDPNDVDLFAWFMRYSASAVEHGHLPALISTAMNAPIGVNMMWNTSFLLPGVVLSPVTLLFGPQVSLTLVLTLGFAGSAASLFWVLRRWGASVGAAALAGAVYGFSPALVVSGTGHYHLQFAVLPPLIIDMALRIVTGRAHRYRTGIWLGLACAAQVFIGEELLVDTVVATVILVVLVAICRPRAVPERIRGSVPGLAIAAVVFLVLDGYALWEQFKGPFAEHSTLQGSDVGNLAWFVVPSNSVLFHTHGSEAEALKILTLPAEYVSYIGWPLIVVVVVAAIAFWRDLRVRIAALAWLILELCALGGGSPHVFGFRWPGRLLPYHWIEGLPGLAQVLPWRFSLLADGAAAVVLAIALDLALAAARRPEGQERTWLRPAFVTVAVLAVLPLVPTPYQVTGLAKVPAGWQATFTDLNLPQNAPVLALPFPYGHQTDVMRWQADTGQPTAMIGGYYLGPNSKGQAAFIFDIHNERTTVERYLSDLWAGEAIGDDAWFPSGTQPPSVAQIRGVVAGLHTAAIVAVASQGSPIARLLTRVFGAPTFRVGGVLSWKLNK
jgi:hypothetical protein